MMLTEDGFPVLFAQPIQVREGHGKGAKIVTLWRAWCPSCNKYHQHGGTLGHRAAHCLQDSLLKKTGYIIRLDPSFNATKGLVR